MPKGAKSQARHSRTAVTPAVTPAAAPVEYGFVVVDATQYMIGFASADGGQVAGEGQLANELQKWQGVVGEHYAQYLQKACAKKVAEEMEQFFLDEQDAPVVLGVFVGGPTPLRKLLEDELSPGLARLLRKNVPTKSTGKWALLELMRKVLGSTPALASQLAAHRRRPDGKPLKELLSLWFD